MRRWVFTLLVLLACTPLIAMTLIFAAARFAWMDRVTLALPSGVRTVVGQVAATIDPNTPATTDRVLRLDTENATAWSRRCYATATKTPSQALEACGKAVRLNPTETALNDLGLAQEANRDFCRAEDSFTRANTRVNARDAYILRNMGRAAYECGHWASSVAVFEVAEEVDAKYAADDDDEDDGDYKDDLRLDREWLVLANTANKNPKDAAAWCAKAHADWKSCACAFDGKDLKCEKGK
jgi:tetratricopeptide (TPR) repeat protein